MQKPKYFADLEEQLIHCEQGIYSVLFPNSNGTVSSFSFWFLFIIKKMILAKIQQDDKKRSRFVRIFPPEQKFSESDSEVNVIKHVGLSECGGRYRSVCF